MLPPDSSRVFQRFLLLPVPTPATIHSCKVRDSSIHTWNLPHSYSNTSVTRTSAFRAANGHPDSVHPSPDERRGSPNPIRHVASPEDPEVEVRQPESNRIQLKERVVNTVGGWLGRGEGASRPQTGDSLAG